MAVCRYCGEKAGWFSEAHGSCRQKAAQGIEALKQCVADAIVQGKQYPEIKAKLDKIVADSNIPQDQVLPAIKYGWSQGAKNRCIVQPMSDDELSSISDFYRSAELPQKETAQSPGWVAMSYSSRIWMVLHDQIDPYHGPVQFNLQHGEVPVFGIANVLLTEERTTSSYVGEYSGASIRIANGVYYHPGRIPCHKEPSASLQEVYFGDFLMTTQEIY